MQSFPRDLLDQLKIHLDEEKVRIVQRISELASQDPFTNSERISDNAASDAEANEESSHDRFSAMGDELKSRLEDLDKALQRVSNGSFGFCTQCGNMIDTDRLAILPTASLCRACEGKKKA